MSLQYRRVSKALVKRSVKINGIWTGFIINNKVSKEEINPWSGYCTLDSLEDLYDIINDVRPKGTYLKFYEWI